MKKYIPTFIAVSIFLGLLTFMETTNFLYASIVEAPSIIKPQIILKNTQKSDTLSISTIGENIPLIEIGENNNMKRLYLNVFPATLAWIIFNSIALSIAVALLIFFLALIVSLIKRFELDLKLFSKETIHVLLPLVLITVLVLILFSYSEDQRDNIVYGTEIMAYFKIIFKDPEFTVRNIEKAYFALGFIPLFGLLIVILATNTLNNLEPNHQRDIKADYKVIKDNLNLFALFSSLLVAVSIIATSLQREMIAEQIVGIESIFPIEFIYVYGITFTLILALFFLPSLAFLKYIKINNSIVINEDEKESQGWWKIGQESIGDIKLIFSIILPFLTSIVQSYFST